MFCMFFAKVDQCERVRKKTYWKPLGIISFIDVLVQELQSTFIHFASWFRNKAQFHSLENYFSVQRPESRDIMVFFVGLNTFFWHLGRWFWMPATKVIWQRVLSCLQNILYNYTIAFHLNFPDLDTQWDQSIFVIKLLKLSVYLRPPRPKLVKHK